MRDTDVPECIVGALVIPIIVDGIVRGILRLSPQGMPVSRLTVLQRDRRHHQPLGNADMGRWRCNGVSSLFRTSMAWGDIFPQRILAPG